MPSRPHHYITALHQTIFFPQHKGRVAEGEDKGTDLACSQNFTSIQIYHINKVYFKRKVPIMYNDPLKVLAILHIDYSLHCLEHCSEYRVV